MASRYLKCFYMHIYTSDKLYSPSLLWVRWVLQVQGTLGRPAVRWDLVIPSPPASPNTKSKNKLTLALNDCCIQTWYWCKHFVLNKVSLLVFKRYYSLGPVKLSLDFTPKSSMWRIDVLSQNHDVLFSEGCKNKLKY